MSNTRTHDPVLKQIARDFHNIPELPSTDSNWSYANGFAGLNSYRHIYLTPDHKAWAARLFFEGRMRTLAVCKHGRESDLARFADLCVIRFWKYRTRSLIPSDADTNYGVERATKDLEVLTIQNHPVIELLNRLEAHLVDVNIFRVDPNYGLPRRETRGTVRNAVTTVMNKSFDELDGKLSTIHSELYEVVKTQDLFSHRFDRIEKDLAEIKALLTPRNAPPA